MNQETAGFDDTSTPLGSPLAEPTPLVGQLCQRAADRVNAANCTTVARRILGTAVSVVVGMGGALATTRTYLPTTLQLAGQYPTPLQQALIAGTVGSNVSQTFLFNVTAIKDLLDEKTLLEKKDHIETIQLSSTQKLWLVLGAVIAALATTGISGATNPFIMGILLASAAFLYYFGFLELHKRYHTNPDQKAEVDKLDRALTRFAIAAAKKPQATLSERAALNSGDQTKLTHVRGTFTNKPEDLLKILEEKFAAVSDATPAIGFFQRSRKELATEFFLQLTTVVSNIGLTINTYKYVSKLLDDYFSIRSQPANTITTTGITAVSMLLFQAINSIFAHEVTRSLFSFELPEILRANPKKAKLLLIIGLVLAGFSWATTVDLTEQTLSDHLSNTLLTIINYMSGLGADAFNAYPMISLTEQLIKTWTRAKLSAEDRKIVEAGELVIRELDRFQNKETLVRKLEEYREQSEPARNTGGITFTQV